MSELTILKWNLKDDIHCWNSVCGCYHDIDSLRALALVLYGSGICGSIQIVTDTATLLEDWSKGYARTSTDIFNKRMREVLEHRK